MPPVALPPLPAARNGTHPPTLPNVVGLRDQQDSSVEEAPDEPDDVDEPASPGAVVGTKGNTSWSRAAAALALARRAQWLALNAVEDQEQPPEWLPSPAEVARLRPSDDPWEHWEYGGMLGLGAAVWEADLTGGTGSMAARRRAAFVRLATKTAGPVLDMTLYVRPVEMPKLLRLPFLLWPMPVRQGGSITFVHAEPFLEEFLPPPWKDALAREYGAKTPHFALAEPVALWRLLRHYILADSFSPFSDVLPCSLPDGGDIEAELLAIDAMAAQGDLSAVALPPPPPLGTAEAPDLPRINLDQFDPERGTKLFSVDFLERREVIPLWSDLPSFSLTVAAAHVMDSRLAMVIEDNLRANHGAATAASHLTLRHVLVDQSEVENYFRAHRNEHVVNTDHLVERVYQAARAEGQDEQRTAQTTVEISDEELRLRGEGQGTTPDATHLIRDLLRWGITNDASDFHLSLHAEPPIRPGQKPRYYTRAYYTIDGLLVDHPSAIPGPLAQPLVGSLKALAGITSGTRLLNARDGYFALNYQGSLYEVRVAVMPTGYDEHIVCRFQNASAAVRSLNELGFREHERGLLLRAAAQKQGLMLVCGATGAGKTNTFWALFEAMDPSRRNILSLERPIERKIHKVTQIPVTDDFGFADGTRALMRAAPNVIAVGETRDMLTMEAACYASETGHLVLTTLHANTAATACDRLINIAPADQRDHTAYRVAEALTAVEAQVLAPTLCRCAHGRGALTDEDLWQARVPESLWNCFDLLRTRPLRQRNPEGCTFCRRNPGERGRTGLFEVFWADEDIKSAIRQHAPTREIRKLHAAQYIGERQGTLRRERDRQVRALIHEQVDEGQVDATRRDFDRRIADVARIRSGQSILGQAVEKVLQGRVDFSRAVGLLAYES